MHPVYLYESLKLYYDRTGDSKDYDNPAFSPAILYLGTYDIFVVLYKSAIETKTDYAKRPVIHVSELETSAVRYNIRDISNSCLLYTSPSPRD